MSWRSTIIDSLSQAFQSIYIEQVSRCSSFHEALGLPSGRLIQGRFVDSWPQRNAFLQGLECQPRSTPDTARWNV